MTRVIFGGSDSSAQNIYVNLIPFFFLLCHKIYLFPHLCLKLPRLHSATLKIKDPSYVSNESEKRIFKANLLHPADILHSHDPEIAPLIRIKNCTPVKQNKRFKSCCYTKISPELFL